MNKETMNRACFFLSGVLRFENEMMIFSPTISVSLQIFQALDSFLYISP